MRTPADYTPVSLESAVEAEEGSFQVKGRLQAYRVISGRLEVELADKQGRNVLTAVSGIDHPNLGVAEEWMWLRSQDWQRRDVMVYGTRCGPVLILDYLQVNGTRVVLA